MTPGCLGMFRVYVGDELLPSYVGQYVRPGVLSVSLKWHEVWKGCKERIRIHYA